MLAHAIYPSWPFVCVCAWAKTPTYTIIGSRGHAWACLSIIFLMGLCAKKEMKRNESDQLAMILNISDVVSHWCATKR
jgi:hypothetical protein